MKAPRLMPKIGACFLTWRRYLQKGVARHGITLKQYYLLGALSFPFWYRHYAQFQLRRAA